MERQSIEAEAFGSRFPIHLLAPEGFQSTAVDNDGENLVIPWKYIEGIWIGDEFHRLTTPNDKKKREAASIIAKHITRGSDDNEAITV